MKLRTVGVVATSMSVAAGMALVPVATPLASSTVTHASAIAATKAKATQSRQNRVVSSSKSVAVFEWRRLDKTPLKTMTKPLRSIKRFGGTRIALDLSYVVDLSEIADEQQRKQAQKSATKKLRSYVNFARKIGLEVEALAGDPRWMEPEVRYVNRIVQEYVVQFNNDAKSTKRRLAGFHIDIEPWGRPDWSANRQVLTKQFLDTLADVVGHQRSLPASKRVPITVDLPFWWDGTTAPKKVKYSERTTSPTAHVIRLLDLKGQAGKRGATGKRVHNKVTVMAYRDTTGGADGSVALSKREFSLANRHKGRVKIAVAQEIGNVQPERITFHQEGAAAMKQAMKVHKKRFSGHKAWGGLAVDHVQALYSKLK